MGYLHPQARVLLDALEAARPIDGAARSALTLRAEQQARAKPATEPIAEQDEVDADGVPLRAYRPTDRSGSGLVVFLHGGGWVTGDLDSNDQVCRVLANASGQVVLSVDYRLAPEHPFPAPLEDALTATTWALAHAAELGGRADRVAVSGSSAGANLAAAVALHLGDRLAFQLLVCPVTDCTRSQPSYEENATGFLMTKDAMGWYIEQYLGGSAIAIDDPRVSPLFATDAALAATPPALVITAERDPLRDEGDAFAARLAAAGVATSHVCFAGMIHGFFSLGAVLDDGRSATALAGEALKVALGR